MTATLTEAHMAAGAVSRPAPEGACMSLEEITSQAAERLQDTRKRRLERAKGLTQLLGWLGTFPGDDWQSTPRTLLLKLPLGYLFAPINLLTVYSGILNGLLLEFLSKPNFAVHCARL